MAAIADETLCAKSARLGYIKRFHEWHTSCWEDGYFRLREGIYEGEALRHHRAGAGRRDRPRGEWRAGRPVTFSGIDGNPTGSTPIAHPNSDAARTSFFSNLTGVGTETFDSVANGTTTVAVNFGNGVTATLTGGTIQNFSSSGRFAISSPNYYNTFSSTFNISFSSAISAFGFYGTDIGDFGGTLSLVATDGTTTTITVPSESGSGGSQPANGSVLYFGFYDTTDSYTNISFQNSNTADGFGFDNFSVGTLEQITPTPEPASMTLMVTGLVGLAALRRRRRKT